MHRAPYATPGSNQDCPSEVDQPPLFDQSLVVAYDRSCQRCIIEQNAQLDVPIKRGIREVRRGDEDLLLVAHDCLRVQDRTLLRGCHERLGEVEHRGTN